MEEKNNISKDVDLLFEISAFRNLDRTWKQFLNPDVANNSEHSFRVAWIALTLARYEEDLNEEKIIKMALAHDLSESRCGDVHYLSRQYVERNEKLAIEDMFEGTSHMIEIKSLIDEYEKRESKESRIVKDADNLDVQIELRELEFKGHSMGEIFNKDRKENVYSKLFTDTARKFWDKICESDPHNWHVNSKRNRHNAGDWKK
ncbi:MAG: HD domain-containing protein [Candidatus Paceibacterota bacterium]